MKENEYIIKTTDAIKSPVTKNHFYLRNPQRIKELHENLSYKSLRSLNATKSDNTIDSYESDWNDFCDWCRYHSKNMLPSTPETIVNYINDLADYAQMSTIRRRISAISENYNAGGYSEANPCRSWLVRETLSGLAHRIGSIQHGKTPIYWEELQKIVGLMDETSLSDIRDKAILLLGFMGAFRRSEIVSLDVENIMHFTKGIVITIPHSKTDQSGEGQQIGIPYIPDQSMCAVRAVDAWISASHIVKGAIFRSLIKGGKVSDNRLTDKRVNLIVKKWVAAIGLDPSQYGGHSLRHGFATYAALHQIEERLIMKQTRHRSVEMVRRYINEADLFTNNPVSRMFGTIHTNYTDGDPS